jgi:predicted GNAT superfamily acetyltransferase
MLKTFLYKELTELSHLQEVVQLQIQTWGEETLSSVPQLVAAIHNGGSVIGVFDQDRVIGFCYGFPGVSENMAKPYLVSHMMAVDPEFRNQKLGERLKFKQREWALKKGYEKIVWTFDPLEIRNGYLNTTKLGGYVQTYISSYYGEMNDKLNKGIPTDRFLLEWDLHSPSVVAASQGVPNSKSHWENYPVYLTYTFAGELPVPGNLVEEARNEKGLLIPIPKQIQEIKRQSQEKASDWRMSVRHAMKSLLTNGYMVRGVLQDDDIGFYVLELEEGEGQ